MIADKNVTYWNWLLSFTTMYTTLKQGIVTVLEVLFHINNSKLKCVHGELFSGCFTHMMETF